MRAARAEPRELPRLPQDADDLFAQIEALDDRRYAELQAASLQWARENTTRALAERFLQAVEAA